MAAGRPLSSRTEHGRVPAAQPWTLSPSRGARCPQRLLCQAEALTSGSLVSSGSITILLWEAQSSVLGRLELAADFSISCCVQRHLQAERGPGGFCTVPVGAAPALHLPQKCRGSNRSEDLQGEEGTGSSWCFPAGFRWLCWLWIWSFCTPTHHCPPGHCPPGFMGLPPSYPWVLTEPKSPGAAVTALLPPGLHTDRLARAPGRLDGAVSWLLSSPLGSPAPNPCQAAAGAAGWRRGKGRGCLRAGLRGCARLRGGGSRPFPSRYPRV